MEERQIRCWVFLLLCLHLFEITVGLEYANLELYFEGFDPNNLIILKNVGDQIRLPFRTDTNRYSDGVTSNVGFGVTSPSFPQYKGFLASPEGRHEGFLAYSASCNEQGVARYGAGDAEKEAALNNLLAKYNETELQNLKAPSASFPVYASIKWNPSHFAIQKGEDYEIKVEGDQMWQDGGILVGPEGYESYYDAVSNCYISLGRCRSHLKKKRRIVSAPWMSMACSIGEFVRPLAETNPNDPNEKINYLPIDEATLQQTFFTVGRRTTIRKVAHTGQLICFANYAHLNYWNNVGSVNVTVTRLSWPPSSTYYYDKLRKPACDSALMVYTHKGNYTAGMEYCNPDGGGGGWKPDDVTKVGSGYGSAVDQSFYLPQVQDRVTTRPDYVTYTSEYESVF
jgi:hypothetical protein